jgi:hypothetical protein
MSAPAPGLRVRDSGAWRAEAARGRPLTSAVLSRSDYLRMTTDYSPFVGSTPQPARLELVRTLWTLTRPDHKPVTAAIYDVETGRELRVHVGSDLGRRRADVFRKQVFTELCSPGAMVTGQMRRKSVPV